MVQLRINYSVNQLNRSKQDLAWHDKIRWVGTNYLGFASSRMHSELAKLSQHSLVHIINIIIISSYFSFEDIMASLPLLPFASSSH